jgi:hypothetical protein
MASTDRTNRIVPPEQRLGPMAARGWASPRCDAALMLAAKRRSESRPSSAAYTRRDDFRRHGFHAVLASPLRQSISTRAPHRGQVRCSGSSGDPTGSSIVAPQWWQISLYRSRVFTQHPSWRPVRKRRCGVQQSRGIRGQFRFRGTCGAVERRRRRWSRSRRTGRIPSRRAAWSR